MLGRKKIRDTVHGAAVNSTDQLILILDLIDFELKLNLIVIPQQKIKTDRR